MVIAFVSDLYYDENNGTSVSAKRFTQILRDMGHEVRVIAIDSNGNTEFGAEERNFGKIANAIIHSQGMRLAKPDKELFRKAFDGCDIVHLYFPFVFSKVAIEVCREMNIPCTAAFHVAPENITSTIYMGKVKPLTAALYKTFYNGVYKYVKHIHCPSLMIANQLKAHGYRQNLHVITNGYHPIFKPMEVARPEEYKDKIVITFIGRFSHEKRHDIIIKAVKHSKYKDKIQLIFGGKGPKLASVKRLAKCLPNYPIFSFFTKEQLSELHNYADLYIHPADVEIEGISAIEAIACGCVPIVSTAYRSATPQFTLCEESRFKPGNYKDLAAKIDWWIEHPEELKDYRPKYAKHALNFQIEKSVKRCEQMFEKAIADWDNAYDNSKDKTATTNIILD